MHNINTQPPTEELEKKNYILVCNPRLSKYMLRAETKLQKYLMNTKDEYSSIKYRFQCVCREMKIE